MMVNIGAFFGPLVTLLFKDTSSLIFYVSAGIISLNFILLLFYKEPGRIENTKSTERLFETFAGIFRNMGSILKDVKFIVFLLIVAGFWTMYNQLFFTLPVFISQWSIRVSCMISSRLISLLSAITTVRLPVLWTRSS